MINRIIFIAFMVWVAIILTRTIYTKLSTPSLPDFEFQQDAQPSPSDENAANEEPSLDNARKLLTKGMFALQKQDLKTAEELFSQGIQMGKSLENSQVINQFIVMLTRIYVEQKDYVKARALLDVTKDQGDIDDVSYYGQLVYLYEKQGDKAALCTTLEKLDTLMTPLECSAYEEDVDILMKQEDKEKVMHILSKPHAQNIADCLGKHVIILKKAQTNCTDILQGERK